MKLVKDFDDYQIIDMDYGMKVEMWNNVCLKRPDPQIIWPSNNPYKGKIDAIYNRSNKGGGNWDIKNPKMPSSWQVKYHDLTFNLKLMGFKHTGLFPEQAYNWNMIIHKIKEAKREVKVLNLEKINEKEYIESDNPKYAYKLLHDAIIPKASVISVGILFHKTDENGKNCPTGYEEFIKKNKINLFSKILHVADSYITLISKENSYNLNIGPAEAMEIIRDTSETLFDKDVVNTFLRKVPIYPDGALVFLSNGEEGIVIDNNIGETGLNYRPVIKTDNGNIYNLMDEKYKHLTIIPNNKNELKHNIKN